MDEHIELTVRTRKRIYIPVTDLIDLAKKQFILGETPSKVWLMVEENVADREGVHHDNDVDIQIDVASTRILLEWEV